MQKIVKSAPKARIKLNTTCRVECLDFVPFLQSLDAGSVDLLLTDPPYAISRKTGFASVGVRGVKRFAVSMDFGDWDQQEIDLKLLAENTYRVLRKGGTAIVFYDLWKLTNLAQALKRMGFVQLRFIEWVKKNPVPLNSKISYLTNSREIAVFAVKGSKPVFNSSYDNGQYHFPIPNNRKRYHPTQKPLGLFINLVRKHSRVGDKVIDPFVGSGTTALACIDAGRHFAGCDINAKYVKIAKQRIKESKIMHKENKITKSELFLELAQPNAQGFSRAVNISEFVNRYACLVMGNGGDWCRDDGPLGGKYNIRRHKEKGKIISIELQGKKKQVFRRIIRNDIKQKIKKQRCVILDTSRVECDHKDGRRDDPRLNDLKQQKFDDFQPLSKAANNAKRQHCKKCRETGKRYDAKKLGFPIAQVLGDKDYNGTCVGCYWHDPIDFTKRACNIKYNH